MKMRFVQRPRELSRTIFRYKLHVPSPTIELHILGQHHHVLRILVSRRLHTSTPYAAMAGVNDDAT